MAKQRDLKPRPDRESGNRGVRPLSHNKTKIFVVLAILSAFAFVAFTIFMLLRSMEDPDIQRFLGLENNLSGEYLGLENDFMVTVIRQVGNYGEIYERNLAPLGLERAGSLNALWTEGGLLYAMPFR